MTPYSEYLAANPIPVMGVVFGHWDCSAPFEVPPTARKCGPNWSEPVKNDYPPVRRKKVAKTEEQKARLYSIYLQRRIERFSRMRGKGKLCLKDVTRIVSVNGKQNTNSTRLMLDKLIETKHVVKFDTGNRYPEYMWVMK